jgi:hypothetical protein
MSQTTFAIPTYRLRDVGETVERYDENFWRNGHSVPILVFDDSSQATHEKYYATLEATRTHNALFYVGPKEKAAFVRMLVDRLKDRRLESVVKNLFRPSYGGNRNFTLMYTLGGFLVSADDDMRPTALIENSVESLDSDEISRGKLVKAQTGGFTRRSYDILRAFDDVLGKRVAAIPANYATGEYLVDTAMDLETNATKGVLRENSLVLQKGQVSPDAVVTIAQTFRTGTNDIDAVDFVDLFLQDDSAKQLEDLNDLYVLVNFRPAVTNRNWRIDCGVSAYDNRRGLPPFFPTRLRFEDYIYRLWIQRDGIVAAHVDAVQNHTRNNYMRNPPAAEIFNEEVANLIKRKLKSNRYTPDDLTVRFEYDGEVSSGDTGEILERITALYGRVREAAKVAKPEERRQSLLAFAENLQKAFYGFEADFFQQNVSRIVDDVVSQIQGGLELWPAPYRTGGRQRTTGIIVSPANAVYPRTDGKNPASAPASTTSQGRGAHCSTPRTPPSRDTTGAWSAK